MENPEHDLPRVIPLLTTSKVPTVLHKAIERFYTPDASLRHPFNVIKPGPSSRQIWLGVYEWYRIISPGTVATINGLGSLVAYYILLFLFIIGHFTADTVPMYSSKRYVPILRLKTT